MIVKYSNVNHFPNEVAMGRFVIIGKVEGVLFLMNDGLGV